MAKKKKTDGRTTVYNNITSPEKLSKVNQDNIELQNDFLDYLSSIDRAKSTIKQYKANLEVFWCWNLENNKNKFFVDLTKREISKFQSHAINVWGWSPNRIRVVKATISSLSNYIENILDDEYEGYKPIVRKIESPVSATVREKTVFTEDDLQELLDKLVAEGKIMEACLVSVAMNSGRRKMELTRFKVDYFDKSNLICEGALYKTPEKMQTKGRGTRGKMLDVYVLAKPFQPYLDMWMEERERLEIKSEWLFPDCYFWEWRDEPIRIDTLDSWSHMFTRRMNKPFYWHSLRHYFTTKLCEANLPDSVVQDIIGWSSSDMLRIYDDRTSESQFDKYFGAEGIKKVESATLAGL